MKRRFWIPLSILIFLCIIGCEHKKDQSNYEIPKFNHDLSYIPFDKKSDNPHYVICDSTEIRSGRNRLQHRDGIDKFKSDLKSNFLFKPEFKSFNGYIVIRFLYNCEDRTGRYRAESLNLNFTPKEAPQIIKDEAIAQVKKLDHWIEPINAEEEKEYSKFINLKINNGKIHHVIL